MKASQLRILARTSAKRHPSAISSVLSVYLGVLAVLPQVKAHTEPFNGRESSLLVARAAAKVEYVCHWNDLINDTTVKPLVLVIGLTLGGIAGLIIAIMLFYLSGKA